jgi:hypothetical protein
VTGAIVAEREAEAGLQAAKQERMLRYIDHLVEIDCSDIEICRTCDGPTW